MTIGPIDYTSRDFLSINADLRALATRLLPEWTDTSALDFGGVLLDLFAYTGDISNYYIDRVANEMSLATASRRSSVLNIAKMLNYTPISMSPAAVMLRFTLPAGTGSVTIPAGTQVSTVPVVGSSPLIFETDVDLTIAGNTIATPQYTGNVTATQGQTITSEIVTANASGAVNQEYSLFYPNVVNGSVTVVITETSGVETIWRSTGSLLNFSGADRVFETVVDDDDVTTIIFGDNIDGHIPPAGSVIEVTYRTGNGASGNAAAGQLTELVLPIVGVQSVTNLQAASGGADAETVDSMRTSIPKSLFALQRAITAKDFASLAIQYPGVAKAQASSTTYVNQVLYIAPVGGGQPTTTLDNNVLAFLADKQLANVSTAIHAPTYVNVNVTSTVHVLSNFYQPSVKTAVLNALQDLLAFENVDFAQDITLSQVYHAIQEVDGVDWCTLSVVVRADAATPSGVQDVVINTGEIPQAGALTLAMVGGAT